MTRKPAIVASLVYTIAGSLWTVVTDRFAVRFSEAVTWMSHELLQTTKGIVYVAFTALLVYVLVRRATVSSAERARALETAVAERTREIDDAHRRIERLNRILQARNGDLETSNRDLTSFAYTISHDLRAPLRAMNGFATIVRRRYADELPEEGAHHLDNIIAAGERMDRQIEDLLAYARLKGEVTIRRLHLMPVLDRIVREREGPLAATGGAIELPQENVEIAADRTLLVRVLENLIDNAIRYRAPDRAPRIRVGFRREGEYVAISVSDNGVGIPPEHRERVFTLFQRLQHDEHTGTGVGLALARRAAEAMHGSIVVDSEVGVGSTFALKLPLEVV